MDSRSIKKVKDLRFCFDHVFGEQASQKDVFQGCVGDLVPGVLEGFNGTVFAYGATGCGKTHTISGSGSQPGIVFLLMQDLFDRIAAKKDETVCEIAGASSLLLKPSLRTAEKRSLPPSNSEYVP